MPRASVRVMLSHDYSHFEVHLHSDEDLDMDGVRKLRADAMQLASEAVEEYRRSKEVASKLLSQGSRYSPQQQEDEDLIDAEWRS